MSIVIFITKSGKKYIRRSWITAYKGIKYAGFCGHWYKWCNSKLAFIYC